MVNADFDKDTQTMPSSAGGSPDSADFELRESAPLPSVVITEDIRERFRLSDSHPALKEIETQLAPIDTGEVNRDRAVEEALHALFANPQALPIVRARIDAHGRDEFLLEGTDGHRFLVIMQIGKGGSGITLLVEDESVPAPVELQDLLQLNPRRTQVIKQLQVATVKPSMRTRGTGPNQKREWECAGIMDPAGSVARFNREVDIGEKLTKNGMRTMIPIYLGKGIRVVETSDGQSIHFAYAQYQFRHSLSMDALRNSSDTQLSLPAFYDLAAHTAATIHALHRNGITHRDVKPGNLLLPSDGKSVMIIDLGYAKDSAHEDLDYSFQDPSHQTQEGTGFGTPAFMAPEQFADAKNATASADWYSTFGTLYFMLTRKTLFPHAHNLVDHLHAHTTLVPNHVYQELEKAGVHPDIINLFRQGLMKDPSDRPKGADILKLFIEHSSYRGTNPDDFIQSIQTGNSPLRLPEEIRAKVSRSDAPFISGYADQNGDFGANNMFLTMQQYPEGVARSSRKKMGRLLWPAVVITGVAGATLAFAASRSDSSSEPSGAGSIASNEGKNVPVQTVSASTGIGEPSHVMNAIKAVESRVSPRFISSAFFDATVENGQLKTVTILKGTPAECTLSSDRFTAHTREGLVYAVTMQLTEQDVARYVGISVESLPQKVHQAGTIARLVLKPESQQYVLAVDGYGLASSDGKKLNVFCEPENAARIRKHLQLTQGDVQYEKCLTDPDFSDVTSGFPSDFDQPSATAKDDLENVKATIDAWKKAIESTRTH